MANTWHVRPKSGSYGAENGESYATAYKGFSDIDESLVMPGDTIKWYGSHDERWDMNLSGNKANHITIVGNADPTDLGIISGATTLGSWTDSTVNDEWYADVVSNAYARDPELMTLNGKPVNKYGSQGSLDEGAWVLNSGLSRVYYKAVGGGEPTGTFVTGSGTQAILSRGTALCSYIDFVGGTISYLEQGLHLQRNGAARSTNITVSEMTYSNCQTWIDTQSVDNIEIKEDNIFEYAHSTGMHMGTPAPAVDNPDTACHGVIIRKSVFRNTLYNKTTTNDEGHVIDVAPWSTKVLIEDNDIRGHMYYGGLSWTTGTVGAEAISIDGVIDAVIRDNLFRDNYISCLQIGPDQDTLSNDYDNTDIDVYNNIFVNNGPIVVPTNNSSLSSIIRIGSGRTDKSINIGTKVHHNTFRGNRGTDDPVSLGWGACINVAVDANEGLSGIDLSNNVFYENENNFEISIVENSSARGIDITGDNNAYYRTAGGDYLTHIPAGSKTDYPSSNSFANWKTATGIDTNSTDGVDPTGDTTKGATSIGSYRRATSRSDAGTRTTAGTRTDSGSRVRRIDGYLQ